MTMKILLPVDGTEPSLHGTHFALRLAREGLAASFVLVNVQEPASLYERVTSRNDTDLIEQAAREVGEDILAPSAQLLQAAGIPFVTAVLSGDPAQSLREIIREHNCDLVIIGSRARGPLRRLLEGGSTSLRLFEESAVPVLLVKPPQEEAQEP